MFSPLNSFWLCSSLMFYWLWHFLLMTQYAKEGFFKAAVGVIVQPSLTEQSYFIPTGMDKFNIYFICWATSIPYIVWNELWLISCIVHYIYTPSSFVFFRNKCIFYCLRSVILKGPNFSTLLCKEYHFTSFTDHFAHMYVLYWGK